MILYSVFIIILLVLKMKLQMTKSGQYFIGMPKDIIKAKRWVKGQEFTVTFNERGNVELYPIE